MLKIQKVLEFFSKSRSFYRHSEEATSDGNLRPSARCLRWRTKKIESQELASPAWTIKPQGKINS
ncbi:hypothetical protein Pfo_030206, partial [Paulownia fortunei]